VDDVFRVTLSVLGGLGGYWNGESWKKGGKVNGGGTLGGGRVGIGDGWDGVGFMGMGLNHRNGGNCTSGVHYRGLGYGGGILVGEL